MRLETLPTEQIPEDLRDEIRQVCIVAHDNREFEKMFRVYFRSGGRHFLAFDGATLVSHAVASQRWLQPEGHPPLRTAYIDAVSTLPDYGGRGYGSAAMRALAGGIDDYEIAALETEIEGFYARLGWEAWRGPLAGRNDDGTLVPTPEQTGVMVLRLARTPDIDLDGPASIEVQTGRIW